jgi:hypothetical protein
MKSLLPSLILISTISLSQPASYVMMHTKSPNKVTTYTYSFNLSDSITCKIFDTIYVERDKYLSDLKITEDSCNRKDILNDRFANDNSREKQIIKLLKQYRETIITCHKLRVLASTIDNKITIAILKYAADDTDMIMYTIDQ